MSAWGWGFLAGAFVFTPIGMVLAGVLASAKLADEAMWASVNRPDDVDERQRVHGDVPRVPTDVGLTLRPGDAA